MVSSDVDPIDCFVCVFKYVGVVVSGWVMVKIIDKDEELTLSMFQVVAPVAPAPKPLCHLPFQDPTRKVTLLMLPRPPLLRRRLPLSRLRPTYLTSPPPVLRP